MFKFKEPVQLGKILKVPFFIEKSVFLCFLTLFLVCIFDPSFIFWTLLFSIIYFSAFLHEIGHLLVAKYFKYKIEKIQLGILYCFIGFVFDNKFNKKYFWISFAGPIVNFVLSLIFLSLYSIPEIDKEIQNVFGMASVVNFALFLTNILPLSLSEDGTKMLACFVKDQIKIIKTNFILCFSILAILLYLIYIGIVGFFILFFIMMPVIENIKTIIDIIKFRNE